MRWIIKQAWKLYMLAFPVHIMVDKASDQTTLNEMTTFQSKRNPSSSIRFWHPALCDPTVAQYSGYLDIDEDTHYFFWLFESKANGKDPHTPLTVWLNGGPGCSSMAGLWNSHGPCRVSDDGTNMEAVSNPYSWHRHSNMLFVDQPVGAGFSYGKTAVSRAVDGAPFFYETLQLFFEAFPRYQGVPVHMFGESYAGRYLPEYAHYIVHRNTALKLGKSKTKDTYINLKSIGLGNPWIDPYYHFYSYPIMACESTYPFTLPTRGCQYMSYDFRTCASLLQQCLATDTDYHCSRAQNFCLRIEEWYTLYSNQSLTDIRVPAIQVTPPTAYIRFLNLRSTRSQIGAAVPYNQCSKDARDRFYNTGDIARTSGWTVSSLLNSTDIRILMYVGDADVQCNWYGSNALLNVIPWTGAEIYRQRQLEPWMMNGRKVGQIKFYDRLTFIRVYDAGRVVPYYQPLQSLAMFHTWISDKSLNPLPPIHEFQVRKED